MLTAADFVTSPEDFVATIADDGGGDDDGYGGDFPWQLPGYRCRCQAMTRLMMNVAVANDGAAVAVAASEFASSLRQDS